MRPKKPCVRVSNQSLERFRRTSRVTKPVMDAARFLKGNSNNKAEKIANIALERIPIDWAECGQKLRLFKRNSGSAILKRKPIGYLHCAERCNLAISLLNATGVKAWLAREMILVKNAEGKEKWHFHDYVEFYSKEKGLHTLTFTALPPVIDTYAIFQGPMEKIRNSQKSFIFRGADSKQIGGVGNWEEYGKYTRKLDWDPKREVEKDKRRLAMLHREGILPSEAFKEINSQK